MKTRYLFIVLVAGLLVPSLSEAQSNTEKHLATIRECYSGAMKMLELRSDPEYPAKDKTVITTDEMWPGSGQHNGKMEIFYGLDLSEEESVIQRFPSFARYSYNIGGQKFYYEILWYDPDDGNPDHCQPVFFHCKNTDYSGKTIEGRYYFWDGKLIKTLLNNPPDTDDDIIPSPEEALQRARMIEVIAKMNQLWNY